MRRMKDKIEASVTNADESTHAIKADKATSADSVPWSGVQGKPSTYTPSTHTHTKSQITDFPTSMPASDVYSWAKASSKPNYTKAEVGLGNVDNTADADKSVKFATEASTCAAASSAKYLFNDDKYMKFHWSGQNDQPTWLWGGNDSGDMYVYKPSNFSVNYATTAGRASTGLNGISSSGTNYVRFYNGTQICWTSESQRPSSTSITWTFQVPFKDKNYCFVYDHYNAATGRGIAKTASNVACSFSSGVSSYSMLAIGRWT